MKSKVSTETPSAMIASVFACMIAIKNIAIASKGDIEDQADISHLRAGEVFENWDQVKKLVIVSVGKPTADGNGMLRVENIRSRRVIDNDGFSKVSANLRKVFDIISLVVVTAFPEKSVMNYMVNIKLIQEGIAVLIMTVSKSLVFVKIGLNLPWTPKP